MRRPRARHVGTAGLVTRYRNGDCTHACRACGSYELLGRWRPAMRAARRHLADCTGDVRYRLTPIGTVRLTAWDRGEAR